MNEFKCLEPMPICDVPPDTVFFHAIPKFTSKPADSIKPARKKARLCFNGSEEEPQVDYNRTYAPTLRAAATRVVLGLGAVESWRM